MAQHPQGYSLCFNLDNSEGTDFSLVQMKTQKQKSKAQLSLFPELESSVKSTVNGSGSIAKLSTYMKTPQALWRLLATYPPTMPVVEAVRRARVDFTKCRKEVAL